MTVDWEQHYRSEQDATRKLMAEKEDLKREIKQLRKECHLRDTIEELRKKLDTK